MERVILKRISLITEKATPIYQAGYGRSRDCCEQVAALTSHIANCFNGHTRKPELLSLTSAPPMVLTWNMDYWTSWQKSFPVTQSRTFACANDLGIFAKRPSLDKKETTLTEDLKSLEAYYKKWRLESNILKIVLSSFTLNNRETQRQLNVDYSVQLIKNELSLKCNLRPHAHFQITKTGS